MLALDTPTRKAAAAVGAATLVVIGWLLLRSLPPAGDASQPQTRTQQPPAETASRAPVPRHPIADAQGEPYASPSGSAAPVDAGDDSARAALTSLFGDVRLERLFNLQGFVRRVVATIDNLPRAEVAPSVAALRPVPGAFGVARLDGDGALVLGAANEERYESYMRLLTAVDAARLVGVYTHFYPVLQQAYRDLGYPDSYFNDRVIEVIDHLLAAPEPEPPVRLSQPRVLYTFANPALESLSAGQKAMIRMGPDNAARVKAKLREIRSRLVGLSR